MPEYASQRHIATPSSRRRPMGLVGMLWARNSATMASTARMASAERRPSRRASAYASSAASVVADVAPASSSAASRSASETNATPPASSTCACSFTLAGMAGFCCTFVRNADVSVAISSEPASAVPSEAPRLVIVFWTPPTSGLSSSGTAETVTAPSCEASAPMPRPTSSIGTNTTSGPASASSAARRTTVPASSDSSPKRTTRRGERCGRKRGMPIAAARSVSGEREKPHTGVDGRQAESDREEERHDEEEPRLHQVLEEEHRQAAGELPVAQHRRAHERLLAARLPARLPAEEEPDDEEPAEHEPDRRRQARPRGAVGLGLDPAPLARAEHAEDEQSEPERREHRADDVELRPLLDRRVRDPPREDEDRDHEHDLAGEDPPPREVGRAEAADERPDRDGDRAGRRDEPVRRRPPLGREVPGDERDDRGQDQRRADSLQERPAEQQHRQALRDRGREASRSRR